MSQKIRKRLTENYGSNHRKDKLGDHASLYETKIIISKVSPDGTKLIIGERKNTTCLGGRLRAVESISGMPIVRQRHLLLNNPSPGTVPPLYTHSVDTFTTGQSLLRTTDYFMVGTGATNLQNDVEPTPHFDINTSLYNSIPFRCVPANTDLSPLERAQYRFRVLKNIGGTVYACYYCKRILNEEIRQYQEGNPNDEYVPTPGDTQNTTTPIKIIKIVRNFQLRIDPNELVEYARINDNSRVIKMNEIGIIMGLDRPNSDENATLQPNELADPELFSALTFIDTTHEGVRQNVFDYSMFF